MRKPGVIQLDTPRLYLDFDRERKLRELTLEQAADQLDVNYLTLACWRRGGGANGDALVRLALWMPLNLRDYARMPADPPPPARPEAA